MANEQNLIPFKPGPDPRRNLTGRPRKWTSTLTDQGYTQSEVMDAIKALMSMTISELQEVFQNPDATVLEKTIAGAIHRDLKKGYMFTMETLFNRVYGKPKETTDINQKVSLTGPINVVVHKENTPQLAHDEGTGEQK